MKPITLSEIESAAECVNAAVPSTPQYSWPLLNARAGCEVWVKHENHTPIGAFKIRGAVHYVARLVEREQHLRGLILATRGNHGQAVAFAAKKYSLPVTILVPHGNSPEKNAAMRALGAELIEHGNDFQAALVHAQILAADRNLHFVPSFHRDLVIGNAVSYLNFLQNTPPLERVYVPIGLGSGICAMIAARDALGLTTKVIGVASEAAPAIAQSFQSRRITSHPATTRIADGLACSTPNPEAFEQILHRVERIITVTDDEIEQAIRIYLTDTHNVAEGAAAAALAALLKDAPTGRASLVLTGANIDRSNLRRILAISPDGV